MFNLNGGLARRSIFIGLLVGLGIVILQFRILLSRPIASTLWADNFDARLIHWILEWGYQALWAQRDILKFWYANSFYPHPNSLAFSDSLISLQLFYTPLRISGLSELPAMYLSLAGAVVFGCVFSASIISGICKLRTIEIAIFVFAAHGSLSVSNFAGHYQLFGVHFAIPCLLGMLAYWIKPCIFNLAIVLLTGALAICCATYFGPILVSLGLCGLLALGFRAAIFRGEISPAWVVKEKLNWKKAVLHFSLILITGLLLYQIQLAPYLKLFGSGSAVDWSEHITYSAKPWSIFWHISSNSFWYRPFASVAHTEFAYSPGIVLILLGLLGIGIAIKQKAGSDPETIIFRTVSICGVLILISSIIFSIGPRFTIGSGLRLPFEWFAEIIPGLSQVRTPGRFGMFVGLGLALMALPLRRSNLPRLGSCYGAVLLFLVIEAIPSFETFKLGPRNVPIYIEAARHFPPRTPLIELPVSAPDTIGTLARILAQLEGSIIHWGWQVSGYGAGKTPELRELLSLDHQVQRGEKHPREILNLARRIGVKFLIIHVRKYNPLAARRFNKMLKRHPGLQILSQTNGSSLIFLDQIQPEALASTKK